MNHFDGWKYVPIGDSLKGRLDIIKEIFLEQFDEQNRFYLVMGD